MDDLLSRQVANCSSWLCHHFRTVSTELADKLRVPSCLKNCSGAEHKNQKVSFTADDGCSESKFVTHSALGLLLFIRPQRACVAASFRSKFLEFSNLTISGIAPATDEFRPSRIIFVIVCSSGLEWWYCVYPGLWSGLCWLDLGSWPAQPHRWLFSHHHPVPQTGDSPESSPRCAFWVFGCQLYKKGTAEEHSLPLRYFSDNNKVPIIFTILSNPGDAFNCAEMDFRFSGCQNEFYKLLQSLILLDLLYTLTVSQTVRKNLQGLNMEVTEVLQRQK